MRIRKRIFEIIEIAKPGDFISRAFDLSIMTLIIFNVVAVILESVNSIYAGYENAFKILEIVSIIIFSIEYFLRVWSCVEDEGYSSPIKGRIKYIFQPLSLIDLFAVLPFYIPMILPLDLRSIRAIRLFRLFRLLKFGRYSESLKTLGVVLKNKKEELTMVGFMVGILLIVSSSLMYYIERDAQPNIFSSIPASMWWGVVTLTTVGYGDCYPVTNLGKIMGSFISFLGIGLFALPAGILGAAFMEEMKKNKKGKKVTCPHCKNSFETDPMD